MQLRIPDDLSRYADGAASLDIKVARTEELAAAMRKLYPELATRIFVVGGSCLQSHVILLHNGNVVSAAAAVTVEFGEADVVELYLVAAGG